MKNKEKKKSKRENNRYGGDIYILKNATIMSGRKNIQRKYSYYGMLGQY